VRRLALVAAALLATSPSCGGSEATIELELVFPPGTDRLPEGAVRVVMALSDPPTLAEAPVAADGSFSLALEIPADTANGVLVFEALDADDVVVARGESAPLPLALYDARFRLFVAPPMQFAEGPAALDPGRAEAAAVPMPFGFLVAGGRDDNDARVADVDAYSIYYHTFTAGEDLPEARSDVTAAAGSFGAVYLFGGLGTGEAASAALDKFDTNVVPDGEYTQLTTDAALARAGAEAAPIGGERWLVTGDPVALLDGAMGRIAAMETSTAQARAATTATSLDEDVVFVGSAGVTLYRIADDRFDDLAPALGARVDHAAIALDGAVLAIGGGPDAVTLGTAALRVAPDGDVTAVPLLARARRAPAVAIAGDDVLVVAGGFDDTGAPVDDAELFDVDTLAPLGTTPLAHPRGGATALRLPNRSVLLVGGRDAEDGAPVAALEIFTP
jgi:hypothetical protein